ncbi:MAG: hypothetical protein WC390_08615 [Sulfurimonas sp.]|jgi:hypothetical protein
MLFGRHKQVEVPKVVEPVVEPVVTPVELVAEPASPVVTKDEFQSFQTTMMEKFDNVTNYFMKQNQPQQTVQSTAPVIDDVSDEEYADAIAGNITDKHKAAAITQKRHEAIAKRSNAQLMQEIEQLKTVGMASIGNLNQQTLTTLPHYKTYKKEIDQAISQLPPENRVNADALKGVYNYIIGGHLDEILASERETVLRQAATPQTETGKSTTGRTSTSRTANASTAPDPTEALPEAALQAIRFKYGSLGPASVEKFAQSQGAKDWETYYKKYVEPLEFTQGNA